MVRQRWTVVGLALGAIVFAGTAPSRGDRTPGGPVDAQRFSAWPRPFTESWSQMVRREALRGRPAGAAAQPSPDAGPLGLPGGGPPAFTIFENFQGLNRLDAVLGTLSAPWAPPDSVGAAGPVQFVELNDFQIALFEKQIGARVGVLSLEGFFTIVQNGVTHPVGGAFRPQVIYDRLTSRWYMTALERASTPQAQNHLLLAVSRTSNATGVFDKYLVPLGPAPAPATHSNDCNSLGLDSNGLYFGLNVKSDIAPFSLGKLAVTPRAPLLAANPQLGPVFLFDGLEDLEAPRATFGIDPISPTTPAWVVGAPAPPPGERANVGFRRIAWNGGVPQLGPPGSLLTPPYAPPLPAPANGSTIDLGPEGDLLQPPRIISGRLWTCRAVGVNAEGTAAGADRDACEWFEIDVAGPAPFLRQTGRLFDPTASEPRFYYTPALTPNQQQYMVLGCSGSRQTEYVGAWVTSRLTSDAPGTLREPIPVRRGEGPYTLPLGTAGNLWGRVSNTVMDPDCGMCVWTVQHYAGPPNVFGSNWATWISQLKPPAPTLNNPNASAIAGQRNVTVVLTGTGLFDGGPTFLNRLAVQLTGGAVNGIGPVQVTYESPTRATVRFDVSPFATPGPRSIVLTNPDKLVATVVNGFTVLPPAGGRLRVARALAFGPVPAGQARTLPLLFRNDSATQSLLVTLGAVSGPYTVSGPTTLAIPPRGQLATEIRFRPLRRGVAPGALLGTSSDPSARQFRIALTGTGR